MALDDATIDLTHATPATNDDARGREGTGNDRSGRAAARARGESRRDDETCDPRAAVTIHPRASSARESAPPAGPATPNANVPALRTSRDEPRRQRTSIAIDVRPSTHEWIGFSNRSIGFSNRSIAKRFQIFVREKTIKHAHGER